MSRTIAMKQKMSEKEYLKLCERHLPEEICRLEYGKVDFTYDPLDHGAGDNPPPWVPPTPPEPTPDPPVPPPDPPPPAPPPAPYVPPSHRRKIINKGLVVSAPTRQKFIYEGQLRNSVPLDIQEEAYRLAHSYGLAEAYKTGVREFGYRRGMTRESTKAPLGDLPPGLEDSYMKNYEGGLEDLMNENMLKDPQQMFGTHVGDEVQFLPREATNIAGIYHDQHYWSSELGLEQYNDFHTNLAVKRFQNDAKWKQTHLMGKDGTYEDFVRYLNAKNGKPDGGIDLQLDEEGEYPRMGRDSAPYRAWEKNGGKVTEEEEDRLGLVEYDETPFNYHEMTQQELEARAPLMEHNFNLGLMGKADPEKAVGRLYLGGTGAGRLSRDADQPLERAVARGDQEEATRIFNETPEPDVIRKMVQQQVDAGMKEIKISGHSTGGWKARQIVSELAEEHPDINFTGYGLNAHGRVATEYPELPGNAKFEYHTMINDYTSMKNRKFVADEKARGIESYYYEPKVHEPIEMPGGWRKGLMNPAGSSANMAYQSHQINKLYDTNGEALLKDGQALDRTKPIRYNEKGELENWEPGKIRSWTDEAIDGGVNISANQIGEAITSKWIDPKLGIKNMVASESAHTAISSGIGGVIAGAGTGVVRAGTQAYGTGSMAGLGETFAMGALEGGATSIAGGVAGGIAGNLADIGTNALLRKAGASADASQTTANIVGGGVGGAVGAVAMTETGALIGAELGLPGALVGGAIGAGVAGLEEIYSHRKALGRDFSKLGKGISGFLGFKSRHHDPPPGFPGTF